jgi:hypothetical protein
MPVPLNEMNSLNIIAPRNLNDGTPRFSNPPPFEGSYKDFTLIEDVLSCQTALPPGTGEMGSMPMYNSSGIIPSYHQSVCPNTAQQGFNNLATGVPPNNMYVPSPYITGQNLGNVSAQFNASNPQYNTAYPYPPFAGSVPNLKDAIATDRSFPIGVQPVLPGMLPQGIPRAYVENFALPQQQDKCKGCSSGHNTALIIILLIIIVLMGIYILNLRKQMSLPKMY